VSHRRAGAGAAPLGVLFANGHLTREQVRAAEYYGFLRAASFGMARPSVSADLVEPYSPKLRSEAHQAWLRERFEDMVTKLAPEQKSALDWVLVDGKLPAWFRVSRARRRLRPVDERERAALLGGLDRLVEL
jgi:hypothetical protein